MKIVGTIDWMTWKCARCDETVTTKGVASGEIAKFACPNCGTESMLQIVPVGTWLMLPPPSTRVRS